MFSALQTTGKMALSIGVSTLCIVGTAKYQQNAREPSVLALRALLVGDAVAVVVSLFWAYRAQSDWQEWSEVNSNRGEITVAAFTGQMEALQQQALMWSVQEQAAFQWQLKQQYGQTKATPTTVEATAQALPAAVDWFDWEDLRNADEHPVLALVGGMGAGKTRLAKFIGRHIIFAGHDDIDAVAFDIYGSAQAWAGYRVVYSYRDMVNAMAEDNDAIDTRISEYRVGRRDWLPMYRVFDESKAGIPAIQKLGKASAQTLEEWQDRYGSITRKVKARVCYCNTALDAESLGMKGGDRDDATIIFPGEKGIAKAMKDTRCLGLGTRANREMREALRQQLRQARRPVLVYHAGEWFPADVPSLDEQGNPPGWKPTRAQANPQHHQLERLLQTEAKRPPTKPSGNLIAWWDWLADQGKITVRQVQRRAPSSLRFTAPGQVISSQQVRALFLHFQQIQFGVATNDGNTFTPFS